MLYYSFREVRCRGEEGKKMAPVLDRFLPNPDVRDRHEINIHAPARAVMEVAHNLDMAQEDG